MKSCPKCQSTYPIHFTLCPQDGTALVEVGVWAEGAVVRGKYRVLCKIGQGGMGAVYKAQHVRFDELRALKVISPELASDPSFVKRFIHEAVITRKLHHPNAVLVDDVDEAEDGRPFIVMEFMQGRTLKTLIRQEGPLPAATVCVIIKQTAAALGAAHTLGMVHRDVKPDNIFLVEGPEGEQVKVLDFGIAKVKETSLDPASAVTLTKAGLIVGTPQYMSPEQAMGMRGDELDGRSDIYSLGIVVYEMLVGRVPFHSDTPLGYLQKHMLEPPAPFRAVAPGLAVSPEVEAVVMKALAKDRVQRYGSALDFALEFSRAVSARTPSDEPRTTMKPAEHQDRTHAGQDRQAHVRAEAERHTKEEGEAERAVRQKTAQERLALEKAEAERRSTPQPPSVPRPSNAGAVHAKRQKISVAWVATLVVAVMVVIGTGMVWLYVPRTHPSNVSTPAQIVVQTYPKAQIYLDDTFKGEAGREGRLVIDDPKPGDHVLRVSLSGKKDLVERVTVTAGEAAKVKATLADVEQPPPPSNVPLPAQIVVQTYPKAQVYLDDTFKGEAGREGRLVIDDPKPGDHVLRVSLSGKKDFVERVTVAAGQAARVKATLAVIEQIPPPVPVVRPPQTISVPGARTVRENSQDGLKYVWIPPGTFMMGCSPGDRCLFHETPAHQVTITRGFWMGRTPVTVSAYKRFAGATGRRMPPAPSFNNTWGNENMPMVMVTWDEAQTYCGWMEGRLPTEAEWEYAARGGSSEARYGNLDDIAWYVENSGTRAHDVGEKSPNGFGLYDMLGNVWEWINDWYDQNYYRNSPAQDPQGASGGQMRVLRGGSWSGNPRDVRVSNRSRFNPTGRGDNGGFRCIGEVVGP